MTLPRELSFVDFFRLSAPYIHAHRGRTFVIMFGGEAVIDHDFARRSLNVKDQMPFAVPVRDHGLVHGIQADTTEVAVKHGDGVTHIPPPRILTMQHIPRWTRIGHSATR